jgi:prevent-host-death family protein
MAKYVGVYEAKAHLSRLMEEAAAGEEIVITRRGEQIAYLVPVHRAAVRRLGIDRGRFVVPDDFDAPLPDSLPNCLSGT